VWHLWKDDIDRALFLGLDTFRFSLEWSRLETSPGEWNMDAVQVYRSMLAYMKLNNITPNVTLLHFTMPMWFFSKKHFLNQKNIEVFSQYCFKAAETFGDLVTWWGTINEPNVMALTMFLLGNHPSEDSGLDN